jgi:transketolase
MPKAQTRIIDIEKLYDLLLGIAQDLEKIYECLLSQQIALMNWDHDNFLATVREQNRLARENLRRESQRKELVKKISAESEGDSVNLRELAIGLGGKWPERFSKIAERIKTASGKAVMIRRQNEFLISKSREMINEQLKLVLDLARLNRNTYESSGKKTRKANLPKVLDQKV